MSTSKDLPENVRAELVRRHKSTATTVVSLLIAVILLSVLAFVSEKFLTLRNNQALNMAFRVGIPILGLGAITLRRTRLARMRLQDIAAIRGLSGLIVTLQRTCLLMALIGVLIAVSGFVSTLMTGDAWYTYTSGVVAAAVLLFYGFPIRSTWEVAIQRYSTESGGGNLLESDS